jgi:hypothetical protein
MEDQAVYIVLIKTDSEHEAEKGWRIFGAYTDKNRLSEQVMGHFKAVENITGKVHDIVIGWDAMFKVLDGIVGMSEFGQGMLMFHIEKHYING